ncbi:hypothetical protein Hamer_G027257 [Homarus americanus]|uniref:Uncharacterized protein n=1 Tax=Homarus americanus TaxID=6706 RepID=A0A8J5J9N1_HOMAM|nr:hypothetical protein Hamer_G027257 [Homarus americanus]
MSLSRALVISFVAKHAVNRSTLAWRDVRPVSMCRGRPLTLNPCKPPGKPASTPSRSKHSLHLVGLKIVVKTQNAVHIHTPTCPPAHPQAPTPHHWSGHRRREARPSTPVSGVTLFPGRPSPGTRRRRSPTRKRLTPLPHALPNSFPGFPPIEQVVAKVQPSTNTANLRPLPPTCLPARRHPTPMTACQRT